MKNLTKFEEAKKTFKRQDYNNGCECINYYDYIDCLTLINLKFDDEKFYVCTRDYQGGNWAVGCCLTAREWAERALQWCDSDGYLDTISDMIDSCNEEQLINEIMDIWQIQIEPIEPLNYFDKNYIKYAVQERYYFNDWYVLRYDIESTQYNNKIKFKDLEEAFEEFKEAEPSYPKERIELIFAPEEKDKHFKENAVVSYKYFGD